MKKSSINDPFSVASSHELMTLTQQDAALSDDDFLALVKKGAIGWAELYAHYYATFRRYIADGAEWYRCSPAGYWEKDKKGVEKNDVGGFLKELLEERYKKMVKTPKYAQDKDALAPIWKLAKELEEPKGINKVLFAADYAFGFDPNEWDSYNDGFLAVSNGIITKDGRLRHPELKDNALFHSDVEFTGIKTKAPKWERALNDIFKGEPEKRDAFQRIMGYAVSGEVVEKIMPILYGGNGNNGKSLLVNIIGAVLGTALTLNTSASKIMTQHFGAGRNSPDHFTYSLFGKRLVFASEANKDVELDGGFVKQMTGTDALSARPSHARNNVDWQPTHTVFLITNDKPTIDGDDRALWNRIVPIEFKMTFVDNPQSPNELKINKYLQDEILATEKSGIIAWLLRGYLDWKKNGLNLPACILDDKASYYAQEDIVGQFVKEATDTSDKAAETKSADLFKMFKTWCYANDIEMKYSQKSFPVALEKHGFRREHSSRMGVYFVGIRDVI
jgi:putative DNA primase/helicase